MDEGPKLVIGLLDKFAVNTIVWLRSLPEDDLGPSHRLVEDIAALAEGSGLFKFEEIVVCSAAEMLTALATLAELPGISSANPAF